MDNRRRRLYIPPDYLSRLVVAPTTFFVLAINSTIILGFLLDEPLFVQTVTSKAVFAIAALELLVLAIAIIALLVTAHRVAGPLYALEKALERLGDGDFTVRLKLRKHDYHSHLVDVFNDNIGKLEQRCSPPKSPQARQSKRTLNEGVTLIELMVVVAIVSILLMISMPMYSNFTTRTKISEGVALVGQFKTAVTEYYFTNARWPDNNLSAGMEEPGLYNTEYVTEIRINENGSGPGNGTITIYFDIGTLGTDNTMEFTPTPLADGSGVDWTCTGGSVDSYFRPPNCR
jgi:type IV pilus assembly protein PilA